MLELEINFPIYCSLVCWQVVEISIQSLGEPGVYGIFEVIVGVSEVIADVSVDDVITWSEEVLFWHYLKIRAEKTQTAHLSFYLTLLLFSKDTEFTFA